MTIVAHTNGVKQDAGLSADESTRLAKHEQTIQKGLKTFYEVGAALLEIRDRRLYRASHGTFEDYCRSRWDMSDSRARQLIGASETYQQVETVTNVTLPNEGTARSLRQFPQDLRPAIAQIATATASTFNKPLTAGMVERVGSVLMQAATTGAVDVNGKGRALDAALTEGEAEAVKRQKQYIADNAAALTDASVTNEGRHKPKTNRTGGDDEMPAFDRCQTPPEALTPLLPYLPRGWALWESAAGEGLLTDALQKQGYRVRGTDILTGQDFFRFEPAEWNCMVTNPPYSIKYKWLARCYELGKPFALLLPIDTLGAQSAQKFFKLHGLEVIFLNRRINFKMPNIGFEGSAAQFATAWFTWGLNIGTQMSFGEVGTL